MRDGIARLGGDPDAVNPLQPAELVIDHSVQVDYFGTPTAFQQNVQLEFLRNDERYAFLKWGQQAFRNFQVVPPGTGIVHQINIEHLARVVCRDTVDGVAVAYPDTLVGTDSHTTMVNGLGVVGWGVGGIEAEAVMLGQPVSMLIPEVVGVKLTGRLAEGTTATDLVLTITQRLRQYGVVGKFVEFFGPGLAALTLADRATLGNMSPEYGSTVAICPIDQMTLDYLNLTGRDVSQVALVEALCQGARVVRCRRRRSGLFGCDPSRYEFGRAKYCWSQAATGPRTAHGSQDGISGDPEGNVSRPRRRRAGRRIGHRVGGRGGCRRRDYQLHEHVESQRDAGCRTRCQEGCRQRAYAEAVGEDESGARLEGRHRVPVGGWSDGAPREARVWARRVTGARPVSVIAVRSRMRWRRLSRVGTWLSRRS